MNKFPLISVIVPAYNAEKWIVECIQSVKNQTYTNWELIVVNDGSTDQTLNIACDLAKSCKKIKVISTPNEGVCKARNRGIEAAQGEYIMFLDADDVLLPHSISVLYEQINIYSADIAIGWKTNMKSDGTTLGCPYTRMNDVWIGTQGLKHALSDHPATYAVWGKLYSKKAIWDVRFVEGKKIHEDSFFVFECFLKQPRVVVVDEIILRYRISENSASRSSFSDKFLDILYFAGEKKKMVEKEYPEFIALAENVIVKANMALLLTLLKTNDKKYRSLQKECIKRVKNGKRFFIPATPFDRKWFLVITYGLYDVYKFLRKVKYKLKCNS